MNLFIIIALAVIFSLLSSVSCLHIDLPEGLCANEVKDATQYIDHLSTSTLMHLAVCLHKNNHASAIDIYNHIRTHKPDFAYVLVNIALLSGKAGNVAEARKYFLLYFDQVGGIDGNGTLPSDAKAKEKGPPCKPNTLGNKVDCVMALNNLGALELTDGRNASAATFYLSRAIEIAGEDDYMLVDTYSNLGGHLSKIGNHEDAADAYIKGFWVNLNRGLLDAATGLLVRRAFLVPTVAASLFSSEVTHINFKRRIDDIMHLATNGGSSWQEDGSDLFRVANNASAIEDIRRIPKLAGQLKSWTQNIQLTHFHVHYYGWYDLPINKAVADMFTLLCPESLFEVHHPRSLPSPTTTATTSDSQKKKIGFVSRLIGGNEPHGLLVLDIMKSLKGLFDFYVVSIGSEPLSDDFYSNAVGVYRVGYDDVEARKVLKSLELDCLVFCESLNGPIIYFLGYQRFAEVQILVMGSPVTSGIPTFDYFVSGDLLVSIMHQMNVCSLSHLHHDI